MPVAIPIIAVAVGAVASAAVGGGIIGALVGAGTAFAITSVGGSVFPSRPPSAPVIPARAGDDATAPGAGRTQSFRQPLTEHQLVFGRIKVGGPMVFIHSATDDQGRADGYFYTVIVLAAHRVQSIGDVWLGDTLATDAKYNGLVRIDRHLGAADQVANANLIAETGGKWTANHRGRGRAYVAVRLKITAQAFPSGPPNIAALVQGANTILDPRSNTTGWSDNPALCLAWYLTAPFGWKASWDDIDIPALIAAANICDELIGTRAGVYEKRYTVNGRVSLGEGIRYYGGHFACGTGINPALDRFGVRFSRGAADAYNNHNRHVFDAPNFELRQLDPNVAIPFLNETNGTAIIARNMRMEGCSPFAARHTAAATDCEYDVAWAQSYSIGADYTPSATRAGNAVFNRHRAPTSRLTRLLAHIPNIRAAAFWQSSTEIGVEGACIMATSTTAETTMAALSWNGLNGITPTARGLLLNPNRGIGFVVQTTHAKEFALAHWLVGGADGGRLCLRCFDGAGIVRENIPGDALASGTTLQWAPTSKSWQAGAVMQESDLNRRQTVRFGPEVAFAQIGIIGFDGQIEVEALRLYGLPEDAPAILSGCPALPAGGRTLMYSASWDLPSMPPGATANADVTVPGARRGDFADASLDTSSIAFVLDCHVWSNDKVRVTARNVSLSTVDLPAAALHVQVVKRRVG